MNELCCSVTSFPRNTLDTDIDRHIIQNETEPFSSAHIIDEPFTQCSQLNPSPSTDIIGFDERRKTLLNMKELRDEADTMPPCARRTTIELLVHFKQILLGENASWKNEETPMSSLEKLQQQLKKEELFSENARAILHDLKSYITSDSYSVILRHLNELLNKIRSLNVREIQRLVLKAKEAAESIGKRDIVLLIGVTGSGKSTTIQFLAGATMKEVRVQISPGKYLEHVTAVGSFKNPELNNVTSSPLQKSETRFTTSVTIQLGDVLGAHGSDELILCDAPGFSDTAGPEVDIANSIGVVEALKEARSVKL